jgi:hypothetical protein
MAKSPAKNATMSIDPTYRNPSCRAAKQNLSTTRIFKEIPHEKGKKKEGARLATW